MTSVQCQACHARVPTFDVTHVGSIETGYRDLCSRCYNEEVARQAGLDFEHVSFQPIDMSDADGVQHRFHFLLRHLGDMLSLEAFEIRSGERAGYEFQVIGAAAIDPFELMGRLIGRIRRALVRKHLVDDHLGLSIAGMIVRGRISCDLESASPVPRLVIDGRDLSWNQFGRMLMTFEGWHFDLEFREPSHEG